MSSNAKELTKDTFQSTVGSGVSLVDFWAEWCGPCRMMEPTLNELVTEFEGKAVIGSVNVDNEMELAQEFGVSSIPTLLVVKDGEEVKRFVGVTSKSELVDAINAALE